MRSFLVGFCCYLLIGNFNPVVGQTCIFSNKGAQGCPYTIRALKARKEAGLMLIHFFFFFSGLE